MESLKVNRSLEKLALKDMGFGDDEAKDIAEALKLNFFFDLY